MLHEQLFSISFINNDIVISRNGLDICQAKPKNGLYVLRPIERSLNNSELFKVKHLKSNKRQKVSHSDNTYLWHLRLGHINLDRINRLVKDGPLRKLNVSTLPVCKSCLEGKMTKRPFSTKGERSKALLSAYRLYRKIFENRNPDTIELTKETIQSSYHFPSVTLYL